MDLLVAQLSVKVIQISKSLIRSFTCSRRFMVLFQSTHKLVRPMPRLDLSAANRTQTLLQLGLKQDQLIVESINDEESEDESDDSMEE